MPEELTSAHDQSAETTTPEPPQPEAAEDTVADFITRNVLEKDAVFFEG